VRLTESLLATEAERCTEEADRAGSQKMRRSGLKDTRRTGLPKPLPPVWEKHRKVKENQSES
jgi:hypothetical protein